MYLHTSTHSVHADMICHQHAPLRCCRPSENGSAIIVILCALYCTVFSPVTWINLTALHSTLHQRCLSLCRWLASGLPVCSCVLEERGFGEWLCREGGILCFQSYLDITSLSEIAYPTFKLWWLTWRDQHSNILTSQTTNMVGNNCWGCCWPK